MDSELDHSWHVIGKTIYNEDVKYLFPHWSPEWYVVFWLWSVGASDLSSSLLWSPHPTSTGYGIHTLSGLIPCAWSLHRIGCPDIRTKILLRARDRTFPLCWWRWWSREPMTAIYLLPLLPRHWSILLALWLSPKRPPPSLPFHTISRCILNIYHIPHSPPSTPHHTIDAA